LLKEPRTLVQCCLLGPDLALLDGERLGRLLDRLVP